MDSSERGMDRVSMTRIKHQKKKNGQAVDRTTDLPFSTGARRNWYDKDLNNTRSKSGTHRDINLEITVPDYNLLVAQNSHKVFRVS